MLKALSIFAAAMALAVAGLPLFGCGKPSSPSEATSAVKVAASARALPGEDAGASTGSIVGVVRWNGPRPELPRVAVVRDAEECAEHGQHDRASQKLVLDDAGGVLDAVVHLQGKYEAPFAEEGEPPRLNQKLCAYEPRVMVVPVGRKLVMTSDDRVGHNIRMTGAAELNVAIAAGGRVVRKLSRPGLVRLGCDVHPWMDGYIHVVRHPYYAVSGGDGRFTLANVPAGTHQVRLWHEPWRQYQPAVEAETSVTVAAGQTVEVVFEMSGTE